MKKIVPFVANLSMPVVSHADIQAKSVPLFGVNANIIFICTALTAGSLKTIRTAPCAEESSNLKAKTNNTIHLYS